MILVSPFFPKNGNWFSPVYQREINETELFNGHDVVGFDGNVVHVYSSQEKYTIDTPGGAITTDLVAVIK